MKITSLWQKLQKANSSHVWECLSFFLVFPLELSYLIECTKSNMTRITNAKASPSKFIGNRQAFLLKTRLAKGRRGLHPMLSLCPVQSKKS